MNVGQKSARRLVASNTLSSDSVCSSCLHRMSHQPRRHAATATATAEPPTPIQSEPAIPPMQQTAPRKAYRLLASPVLSRPPMLTRELDSFEKAYYLYQKRLNERLALPFTRYFYYKKGTPGDIEWKRKIAHRKTAAKDIGIYSGYGKDAWADEVMVGDKTAEPDTTVSALINDAEGRNINSQELVGDSETGGETVSGDGSSGEGPRKGVGQQVSFEKPHSRITEADRTNDQRSLNRKMDRSLYLVIKNGQGRWRFPEDRIYGRENLHQAAERILIQAFGLNMNTWVVGNHPVGHFDKTFAQPKLSKILPNRLVRSSAEESEQEELGEKVFFMKSRIMAGKPDMAMNEFADQDYKWLAKEELEEVVDRKYWNSVKNMLAER